MQISKKSVFYFSVSAIFVIFLSLPFEVGMSAQNNGNSILPVSATVLSNCQFGSEDVTLAFGTYDPVTINATRDKDATTQFKLRCIKGTTAKVVMNNGQHAIGGIRRMKGPGNSYLNYQLYTDSTRTSIWDNSNALSYTSRNLRNQQFKVFGRIPAGQNAASGSYTDTVIMSITF